MKKNIKTIELVLTDIGLNRFKTIPTFKNLLHKNVIDNLKVGENKLNINHFIYSKLLNLQDQEIKITQE